MMRGVRNTPRASGTRDGGLLVPNVTAGLRHPAYASGTGTGTRGRRNPWPAGHVTPMLVQSIYRPEKRGALRDESQPRRRGSGILPISCQLASGRDARPVVRQTLSQSIRFALERGDALAHGLVVGRVRRLETAVQADHTVVRRSRSRHGAVQMKLWAACPGAGTAAQKSRPD
jgi:hypothetical protein